MNPTQQLKSLIQDRKDWEAFGWGPALLAWGVLLVVRSVVSLFVVLSPWWDGLFWLAALATQLGLNFGLKSLPPAARRWPLHGFWIVTAVVAWGLSSGAPALGLLSVQAGQVLQLLFLGGALYQTGLIKERSALRWGGVLLVVTAVVVATWSAAAPSIPLVLALAFVGSGFAVIREKTQN